MIRIDNQLRLSQSEKEAFRFNTGSTVILGDISVAPALVDKVFEINFHTT